MNKYPICWIHSHHLYCLNNPLTSVNVACSSSVDGDSPFKSLQCTHILFMYPGKRRFDAPLMVVHTEITENGKIIKKKSPPILLLK